MNQLTTVPASSALTRAAVAGARTPRTRKTTGSSRTADKFLIRGFAELFDEVGCIGLDHGRSANAEVVLAILDALSGQKKSASEVRILRFYLGEDVANQVLSEIPQFTLDSCKEEKRFVVRFPPAVRDKIREGVRAVEEDTFKAPNMNEWVLKALADWVNVQRQHHALLSAAVAMDQHRLEAR
ncbi:DNA-binding protein [Pseudomonas syringae pv. actinidiae]|nr:DNA-binding protein [Pseudomonas syringae pv. actinidiae]